MKKENWHRSWITWIALGLSIVSILLWVCKYEPVTWTLLDIIVAVLSLIVAIIAVLFGFNMFGLKKELSEYVNKRTDDLENELYSQNLKSIFYIETRMLHLSTLQNNKEDIEQSIYMMIDIVSITKKKEDIDYIIQQINNLKQSTDAFQRRDSVEKLKIKLEKISDLSCDAAILLKRLSMFHGN